MNREEFIKGLRELAEFYEQHEAMPVPVYTVGIDLFVHGEDDEIKAEMARIALEMSPVQKVFQDDWFILRREFGLFKIDVNASRNKICTARVVRVEHIPEQYIPGSVVPAHDKEIVEWDCHSILKDALVTEEV